MYKKFLNLGKSWIQTPAYGIWESMWGCIGIKPCNLLQGQKLRTFEVLHFISFVSHVPAVVILASCLVCYASTWNLRLRVFLFCCTAADIVFDYRQKITRSFEYLQGDYYIAPLFMVRVSFIGSPFHYMLKQSKCALLIYG